MRPDLAVLRCGIDGVHERHVAVGTPLRVLRVVERPRALSRHSRCLPVVVIVEAAEPPIAVHRNIEVDLVARRAELRGLFAMERLQERVAVRFRREEQERVVRALQHRVLAGREIVHRRVLDLEVTLTHGAVHFGDRMAGGAGQARLRFGRADLLLDGTVEPSVEEHRVIVTTGAPFRGPRADHVLHVLDRLAVPLVVERRKMMCRRAPLLVDVAMTPCAALARHEEGGRDDALDVCVRGRGEEGPRGPGSFGIHRRRRGRRIRDAIRGPPPRLAAAALDGRRSRRRDDHDDHGANEPRDARAAALRCLRPAVEDEKRRPHPGHRHVCHDEAAIRRRRADDEDRNPQNEADSGYRQARLPERVHPDAAGEHLPQDRDRQSQAEQRMHRDLHEIPQRRIRERPEVRRIEEQRDKADQRETR